MATELQFPNDPVLSCLNCGFLGKLDIVRQTVLIADKDSRNGPDMANIRDAIYNSLGPSRPVCFVDRSPIGREYFDVGNSTKGTREDLRAVLAKERPECEKTAIRWRPWLTPQEHWQLWREDLMHGQSMSIARLGLWIGGGLSALAVVATVAVTWIFSPDYPDVQNVILVTPSPSPTPIPPTATPQPSPTQ